MRNLFLYLFLVLLLYACKKDVPKAIKTLNDAGYRNEIDSYKPGTYWIYTWQEYDLNGNITNSGFDTITVTSHLTYNSSRELTGTVYNQPYTQVYQISNDSVIYYAQLNGMYNLYWQTRILFDSSQVQIDYPLNSSGARGCSVSLEYSYAYNIPKNIYAGNFITVESKQLTYIAGDNGGCDNGYEIVNYTPRIGEVYRETSYPNTHNYGFTIRYTRQLFAYHIAQ